MDERTPAGRRGRRIAALAVAALAASAVPAQAALPPEYDPDAVARAIVADAATLDAAATGWHELAAPVPDPLPAPGVEHDAFPAAVVAKPLGGFPTAAADFAILSNGDVWIVDEPNDSEEHGVDLPAENGALHGDTDYDVTVLKVGVQVPAGANCVSLDYRFLSEEFDEYVGAQYNDAFIAEIDPPGGAPAWTTNGSTITHSGDFATAPNGGVVSINGVGGLAATAADAAGTTFDGATGLITTKAPITPGPHSIFLSIFDQGDARWDSAVFLDRLAFFSESSTTCRPPQTPGTGAPPAVNNDIRIRGGKVTLAKGAATITVRVPGPGKLRAAQAPAAKKQAKLIKPATKTVAKAGAVKLRIKPTKAGLKRLNQKRALPVRIAVRFTPTGGPANTEVAKVTIKPQPKPKAKPKPRKQR
jgi:hypothetical protein